MLIVMTHDATDAQINAVEEAVAAMGLRAEPIPGSLRTAIGVLGNQGYVDDTTIRELPGVRYDAQLYQSGTWSVGRCLEIQPRRFLVFPGRRFSNPLSHLTTG